MKAFCAYNDVLNVMQKNLVCNINNEIKQKHLNIVLRSGIISVINSTIVI